MFSNITVKKLKTSLFLQMINNLIITPLVVWLIFPLFVFIVSNVFSIDTTQGLLYNIGFWQGHTVFGLVLLGVYWYVNGLGVVVFFKLISDLFQNKQEEVEIESVEIVSGAIFAIDVGINCSTMFFSEFFCKKKTENYRLIDLNNSNEYVVFWNEKYGGSDELNAVWHKCRRAKIKYLKNSKIVYDIEIFESATDEEELKEDKYKGLSVKDRKILLRKEKKKQRKLANKELYKGRNTVKLEASLRNQINDAKKTLKFDAFVSIYLFLVPVIYAIIWIFVLEGVNTGTIIIMLIVGGIGLVYPIVKIIADCVKLKKLQAKHTQICVELENNSL